MFVGNDQSTGPHSQGEYDLLSTEDHPIDSSRRHSVGVDADTNPSVVCVFSGDDEHRGSTKYQEKDEVEIESMPSPLESSPRRTYNDSDTGSPAGQQVVRSYHKMSSYIMPDPPWMEDMDPISYFYGGLLEEIEYAFFHNCLVRYSANVYDSR